MSPRGSVADDNRVGSPASTSGAYISGYQELDVPSKTRRTSGSHLGLLAGDPDLKSYLDSRGEDKREHGGIAELFLPVPFNFSWNKPKPENPPLFRLAFLSIIYILILWKLYKNKVVFFLFES